MKFSVVITTKDRITFLERTIKSILSSSILPSDIVIINDGGAFINSDDFDSSCCKIKLINTPTSMGANYSRNLGVEISSSEIVFLLDDDDTVTTTSFADRLELFKISSYVGLVFTGVNIVRSSDLSTITRKHLPFSSKDYYYDLLSRGNVIGSTSRVAIKKKFFNDVGGFDESLHCMQDYDLWIRMAQVCKIYHDGKANILYTVHDDGRQVSSKHSRYFDASRYLRSKYILSIQEHGLENLFDSHMYLRVALSAASTSFRNRVIFSLLSFIKKPSLKAMVVLFFPYFLLRKMRAFA